MRTIFKLVLFLSIPTIAISCGSAKKTGSTAENKIEVQAVSIAFYNLENLFDTINQSNNDEEFLPEGAMKWTGYKYKA